MIFLLLLLLLLPVAGQAQTCNTSTIECNSKDVTSIAIGPPGAAEADSKEMIHIVIEQDKLWNPKLVTSIAINPAIMGATKLLTHVVVIPGTAVITGTYPVVSPRTHP